MALVGTRIGSIRIEARIGAGGMGEVFRGFDEKLERRVAIKTVHREQLGDPETRARFLREARLLSKLEHPGICQIHDLVETPDGEFLILEYVEGRTLREHLARGATAPEVLRLALAVARALAAAHAERVVHRDLKPDNVMVLPDGAIKILDFGIGRVAEIDAGGAAPAGDAAPDAVRSAPAAPQQQSSADEPTEVSHVAPRVGGDSTSGHYVTEYGTVLGTRRYMSPEQAGGGLVSTATDIYAFGVMVEEALELAVGAAAGPSQQADAELAALIAEMRGADPVRRPSAPQVVARLELLLDKPRRLRRRRLVRWLALTGIVALLAIAAGMSVLAWRAARARDEAVLRRTQAEQLIEFMLGDLRNKLEGVGKLELLADVNQRAMQYFEAIPADQLSELELEQRIVHLQKIADVAVQSGQLQPAEAAIRHAATLAERWVARAPGAVRPQLLQAETMHWLGFLLMERSEPPARVLEQFEAALALNRAAVVAAPDDVVAARELTAAYNNVGAAEFNLGRLDRAIPHLEAAVTTRRAVLPRLEPDAALRERAAGCATLGWLSSAFEAAGRIGDALATRQRQVAEFEALLATDADHATWHSDLAVALRYRAMLEQAVGDTAEAEHSLRHAHDLATRLVERDAANASWRRAQAMLSIALGQLLAEQARAAEAGPLFEQAAAEFGALLEQDAGNAEWRMLRGLATTRRTALDAHARHDAAGFARLARDLDALEEQRRVALSGDALQSALAHDSLLHARALAAAGAPGAGARARAGYAGLQPLLAASSDWQLLGVAAELAQLAGDQATARALAQRVLALGARPRALRAVCGAALQDCPAPVANSSPRAEPDPT